MSWPGSWEGVDEKWHARFAGLATDVATWSKDPKCQVGALLVAPGLRQFSAGFNGLPRGLVDEVWLTSSALDKNAVMIHAEVNALDNSGFDPAGAALYVTRHPCLRCALSIINRSVGFLLCPPPDDGEGWGESQRAAEHIMEEAAVRLHYRRYWT